MQLVGKNISDILQFSSNLLFNNAGRLCLVLDLTQKFIPNYQLMHSTSESTKWYTGWLSHVIGYSSRQRLYDKKLRAGHNDIPLNYVANDDTHDSL